MGYPDFNDMNISASTAREVSIVNIEIVGPLEALSPRVLRDVLFEVVHEAEARRWGTGYDDAETGCRTASAECATIAASAAGSGLM